ncbi:hypothetical protein EDB86DRAFT_3084256 [Lactarius hatsudake]|nr:hypothetical protein EDB86DRAFT_3084256 [Lactarius hatsudake]
MYWGWIIIQWLKTITPSSCTRHCALHFHLCEVSRRAEARITISNYTQPTDLYSILDRAALARGLIPSTSTRLLSPQTYIWKHMSRGGLRDTL